MLAFPEEICNLALPHVLLRGVFIAEFRAGQNINGMANLWVGQLRQITGAPLSRAKNMECYVKSVPGGPAEGHFRTLLASIQAFDPSCEGSRR